MLRSEDYRRLHIVCLDMARQSGLPDTRARWLAMAAAWHCERSCRFETHDRKRVRRERCSPQTRIERQTNSYLGCWRDSSVRPTVLLMLGIGGCAGAPVFLPIAYVRWYIDRRPAHYRKAVAGVKVLVGGEWIVVPEDTIQYRTLERDPGATAAGHGVDPSVAN